MTSQALTISPKQTSFTQTQLAALQHLGIDQADKGDLDVFMHYCQRTGLDPFTRQIYMIGRNVRQGNQWVKRWTIQTAIDGARLIARRAADRDGSTYSTSGPFWCGTDGKWVDVWLKPTPPAAAKYVVHYKGGDFTGVVRYDAYKAVNKKGEVIGLWGKMADTMLAKCAEALALRKAFPQDLSGLYVSEEMQQADNNQPQATQQEPQTVPPQSQPAPQPQLLNQAQIEGIQGGMSELGLTAVKAAEGIRYYTKGRTSKLFEMTVEEGKALARHINERLQQAQEEPPVDEPPPLDVEVVEE
ncbi:MAG: phage recombination protein Bet [Varibaculum cambriense]|uniref:phage recombination protein Bet n=1 Tax=Varibaculum cambriense TaxID=184870 RepID=UPI00290A1BC1|nr:phage recombination protein Bet [Varibaculum cambriense]MDU4028298.1 phage recombination protein Bet [Varibaculum cambriense]